MNISLRALGKYKYVLLLMLCAALLLMLPQGGGEAADGASEVERRLEQVVSDIDGAGRVSVLCSEDGAAVVCDGAGSAAVRLDIVRAVGAYTGLGADRISVLPMAG